MAYSVAHSCLKKRQDWTWTWSYRELDVRMHEKSTLAARENNWQHPDWLKDIPMNSSEPLRLPGKAVQTWNKFLSAELFKGEWDGYVSCNSALTSTETEMFGASEDDENARKVPKKVLNASEHISKQLEWMSQKNWSRRVPNKPGELGSKTIAQELPWMPDRW